MPIHKKENKTSSRQSRGSDLRAKIIESQIKGEEYRSSHQGTDQRLPDSVKEHKPGKE